MVQWNHEPCESSASRCLGILQFVMEFNILLLHHHLHFILLIRASTHCHAVASCRELLEDAAEDAAAALPTHLCFFLSIAPAPGCLDRLRPMPGLRYSGQCGETCCNMTGKFQQHMHPHKSTRVATEIVWKKFLHSCCGYAFRNEQNHETMNTQRQ